MSGMVDNLILILPKHTRRFHKCPNVLGGIKKFSKKLENMI